MQPTPTRSPTFQAVTASPTASTTPAISWPTVSGKCARPHSLRMVWMSLWQMPAALMSMTTSSARGVRRSIMATRNGSSGPVFCSALTVVLIGSPCDRTFEAGPQRPARCSRTVYSMLGAPCPGLRARTSMPGAGSALARPLPDDQIEGEVDGSVAEQEPARRGGRRPDRLRCLIGLFGRGVDDDLVVEEEDQMRPPGELRPRGERGPGRLPVGRGSVGWGPACGAP